MPNLFTHGNFKVARNEAHYDESRDRDQQDTLLEFLGIGVRNDSKDDDYDDSGNSRKKKNGLEKVAPKKKPLSPCPSKLLRKRPSLWTTLYSFTC
jgi:hypothetical protein